LRVRVDVLLEEPDSQIAAELAGAFFTLVEGNELVLGLSVKHEIESSTGLLDPAAAQFLALDVGGGLSFVHDDYS